MLGPFDAQSAERYAKQALERNANDFAAKRVLARAYVIRGDATKAIATAREAMQADTSHNSNFELVEVLIALDRTEEAHQELERLRSEGITGLGASLCAGRKGDDRLGRTEESAERTHPVLAAR